MTSDYKYTYKGVLEMHYEQGIGGHPILHDDRGNHVGPSFNNETKQYDGPPMTYRTLAWAHWFDKNHPCHLTVFDKEDPTKVIFEGELTADRRKMCVFHHYVPNEIEMNTWRQWCFKEHPAIVKTNSPVSADEITPDSV